MINIILGIEIIILQVVNSEAFPDINLAISSPFKILAKLEKILEANIGFSLITCINILSKNAMDIDPETNFYANKARLAWLQIEDDFEHMSQKIQHKAVIANEMLNAGYTNQAINGFENILNEIDSLNIQAPSDFLLGIKDMLAISHLRLGEEYNCIEGHNSESCIIPLRGSGIHLSLIHI